MEQMNSNDTEAAASGLTVWRVLSDAPHYKLVSDTDTVAVSLVILSGVGSLPGQAVGTRCGW